MTYAQWLETYRSQLDLPAGEEWGPVYDAWYNQCYIGGNPGQVPPPPPPSI